jgi:hypothetical protein
VYSLLFNFSDFRIRIRLDSDPIGAVDPDPGGKNDTQHKENSKEISCFKVLNVLLWGLESSPEV